MRPFGEKCTLLVVSAQGCGFQSSEELQVETPIMLSGLPGGGSVTARVANCVPLGSEGNSFLIGAALYTQGNVWGIANPPEDWKVAAKNDPVAPVATNPAPLRAEQVSVKKKAWPYNVFVAGAELHPGRK